MTDLTHDRIKLMSLYNVTGNARIMIDQVDHDACAIRQPRFFIEIQCMKPTSRV